MRDVVGSLGAGRTTNVSGNCQGELTADDTAEPALAGPQTAEIPQRAVFAAWRGSITTCIGRVETDRSMDASTDAGTDGRWMSYAELAELRGIEKPSALKLALRRRWPRQKDNHGTCRYVSRSNRRPLPAARRDIGTDAGVDLSTAFTAYQDAKDAFLQALKAKAEQVTLLREQLEHERDRADAAEARAVAAHGARGPGGARRESGACRRPG